MATINATTINEAFALSINEGMKAAKTITDPAQRATAYSGLASALASTGHIATGGDVKMEETTSAPVVAALDAKDSLKSKPRAAATKPASTPAPVKEVEAAPAAVIEPELTDEWTPEAQAQLADELTFIQAKQVEYGDAALDGCVKAYSDNVLKTVANDISPLNIKAFVAYILLCEADNSAEQSA